MFLALPGNNYDASGVVINTHLTVERPPTVVQNVNMREVRHNMGGDMEAVSDVGCNLSRMPHKESIHKLGMPARSKDGGIDEHVDVGAHGCAEVCCFIIVCNERTPRGIYHDTTTNTFSINI